MLKRMRSLKDKIEEGRAVNKKKKKERIKKIKKVVKKRKNRK